MNFEHDLDQSLQQASMLLEKSRSRQSSSKKNLETENLKSIQTLSNQLASLNSNLLSQTTELMNSQTKTLTRISVDQVDQLFQVQHRWLRNQVRQIRELKSEIADLKLNDPMIEKSISKVEKENVNFLEQKVDSLTREIRQLTAQLKPSKQSVLVPKNDNELDYASIASTLKALRSQTRKVALDPVWKEPSKFSRPSSPVKRASSPVKRPTSPVNRPTSPTKKPVTPAKPKRNQNRPDSTIPNFYNVRLANAPIFLRRTSIRPPSPSKPLTMNPKPPRQSKPVDTKPKVTVHSRQSNITYKSLPLDLGYHIEKPLEQSKSTSTSDLPKSPKPEVVPIPVANTSPVSPAPDPAQVKPETPKTSPKMPEKVAESTRIKLAEPEPVKQKDEAIQHSVRNVSIQHYNEESLSISDSDPILITGEVKPVEKKEVVKEDRGHYTGKTMEQRLAEWIQQEVLLRLVQGPRVAESMPESIKKETQVETQEVLVQTKELTLDSFVQTEEVPLVPETKEIIKEVVNTEMQTVEQEDYDDPSHIVELSDASSVSISISSASETSEKESLSEPLVRAHLVTDEEVELLYEDIVDQVVRTEVLQAVYEYLIQVGLPKPVTPLPSVDIVTEEPKIVEVLVPPVVTIVPDPVIVQPIPAKIAKEEEDWSRRRNLSAEESLLVDFQKLKQEAMDQLDIERQRVRDMEIEKQSIETELEMLRKLQEKRVVDVSVQMEPVVPESTEVVVIEEKSIEKSTSGEQSSLEPHSVDIDETGDTPSYSSILDPTSQHKTTEKKSDDSSMSLTISSLPTYSEGELLFSMGEVGPSVNRILKNESSSDQKTSSGSVSLSEGQVMVLESVSADQVTSSFLHSSESHDDSKDSGGLESQIQKSLKSPDVSIDEHSMSQIQSTSINISMIAPEEKP